MFNLTIITGNTNRTIEITDIDTLSNDLILSNTQTTLDYHNYLISVSGLNIDISNDSLKSLSSIGQNDFILLVILIMCLVTIMIFIKYLKSI